MPDKFGFDHLPERGMVTFRCIEKDCNVGGLSWDWPESRREIHFLTHNFQLNEDNQPVLNGLTKTTVCHNCGRSFEQERKRGRPRVKCYVCKPQ